MRAIRGLERALALAEERLLAALIVFMTLLAFLQVVLRVVFSSGILWADILLRHLVLWLAFLGAGLAAGSDRQFAMDLAERFLRGRLRSSVRLLCRLFAAVVSLYLLTASLSFFREEYAHSSVLFEVFGRAVPAWPFETVLPGGFALLFLHYVLKSAGSAAELKRGTALEE